MTPSEAAAILKVSEEDVKAAIGSGGVELKAGTKGNQHIVALKPHGSGTEYAIVYVSTHGKGDTI